MISIIKQVVGDVDKSYEVLKTSLKGELKAELKALSEEELINELENSSKDIECNRFGEEFSNILLNSNFQLEEDGLIKPSLSIELTESEEVNKSERLGLEYNAIDFITELSLTDGFIIFMHNSKKIVTKSNLDTTSYFKDTEPVFLNRPIAKPLSSIRVLDNSIVVDYEFDGIPFFFELLSISDTGIVLSDFDVQISIEEYKLLRNKLPVDDIRETNDKVTFKISNGKLGRLCYEILDVFNPLMSSFLNRKRVLCAIKDTSNLVKNKDNLNLFLDSYREIKSIGLSTREESIHWKSSKIKPVFDLKHIEDHKSEVKEFIAMLEIKPYNEFFAKDLGENATFKEVVKITSRLNNINLDGIDKEIKLLDLYILKLMSERIKLDNELDTLWIPTNYGQEVYEIVRGEIDD